MKDVRIMLVGLSGSGKTSILNEIKNRYSNGLYITFGDIILEICRERHYNLSSRDQILREVSKKDLLEIQKEAYSRLIKKVDDSNAMIKVIDNHLVLRSLDGYLLGFSSVEDLRRLKINYYFFIYCNPKVLRNRIENDVTRKRNIHEADLQIMTDMTSSIFSTLISLIPESQFYVIDNTSNSVKNIVDVFIDDKIFLKK